METDVNTALTAFYTDAMKKLDDLEYRLGILTEPTSPTPLGAEFANSNLVSINSTSSLMSSEVANMPNTSSDEFKALLNSYPADAVSQILAAVRGKLARKASTKRLIEKANSQYVDSTFQRISTQLTASINQQILQNHNNIETEIEAVNTELDKLEEHMNNQFEEIRKEITELQALKKEVEQEGNLPKHIRASNRSQRGTHNLLLRRTNAPILSRKKDLSGHGKLSMTLTNSKI